jgi:hypothetical protein
MLDKFTAPAIVRNGRMDLVASNHLGRAMHAALNDAAAGGQPSFARFTFLNLDAAHDFYPDWDGAADTCIAILRTEAGRDPTAKGPTTSSVSCPPAACARSEAWSAGRYWDRATHRMCT